MNKDLERATTGEEVPVDPAAIEKTLAELWRSESENEEHALTRAALWNVVAHTANGAHQTMASETLGRVSAAIPQRTIIICADPAAESKLRSSISANCHPDGGGKQVCSEEIAIIAGGDHIHRIPPLVNSLLIPDMPVAVWFLGDLPSEHEAYVDALLEPADRLIVDSVHFDSPADLALISRMAEQTSTAPADLNWLRLEEWRGATAAIFDPPAFRNRLRSIRRVRVVSAIAGDERFGQTIESLFYASWLSAQLGHHVDRDGHVEGPAGTIDYVFERRKQSTDVGGVAHVEMQFDDGSSACISRSHDCGVLTANLDGLETTPESVIRSRSRGVDDLIVRQLKKPEGDPVFLRALPISTRLAKRLVR
jgi:glucose-6-phosphate dehydrogenase assembly protein OpcA